MKIESKFGMNEKVYVLDSAGIKKVTISIVKYDSFNGITYVMQGKDIPDYKENKCFATKEELIKSL